MLKKPENWENVEVVEYGDYESLKLGGHEVVIKKAYEYTGMTGNNSLKIEIDIAGNDEQKGYFQKQFDNNTNKDKKWSNGACKYVSLKEDEKCVAMLKSFTTAVENSNAGYKWDWDETKLVNKKLCGVFGLEEYEKQDGTIGTATKLVQFRSLDKLKDVKIPKVKLLDNTFMDYEEYISKKQNNIVEYSGENLNSLLETMPISEDELPF